MRLTPKQKIEHTIATYNEIANTYARKSRDRSTLDPQYNQFLALLDESWRGRYSLLDIGCGPGYDTQHFALAGWNTIGMDLSHAMISLGALLKPELDGADFVQANMLGLPLASMSIAGIWSCASLLHIPYELVPIALSEFYRVLVPMGVMCISVKLGEGERWVEQSHGHELPRYFTFHQPQTLDPLLDAAGFETVAGWVTTNEVTQQKWLIRFVQRPHPINAQA